MIKFQHQIRLDFSVMPYKQYAAVYNALVTSLKDKKVDKYHYLALGIITVNFAIYWKFIQNFLVKSILVHCAEGLASTCAAGTF